MKYLVLTLIGVVVITGLIFPFSIVGAQECDWSQHNFKCDSANGNIDGVGMETKYL